MSHKPKLESLIALLYESVLEPSLMKEALGLCSDYTSSNDAMIMTFDKKTDLPINAILSEKSTSFEAIDAYVNHYIRIDPRTYINKARLKEWRCCHEINDQHFVNHNEFYQDYLLPSNARYLAVTRVYEDAQQYTLHALVRNVGQNHFDNSNITAANRFFDHLQRTLRLHKQTESLQQKIDLGAIAIDNLPLSMIIVNSKCQILHLNRLAEILLNTKQSGLHCVMKNLVASHPKDRHNLSNLIINAAMHNGQGGQMQLNTEIPKYIFVTPISAKSTVANNWQTPLALVLINNHNQFNQLEFIKNFYSLTPTELRLVEALINGKSIENYRQEVGVTINTVRTQLSSIFKKTNTSRQGELIALLKSIPSYL